MRLPSNRGEQALAIIKSNIRVYEQVGQLHAIEPKVLRTIVEYIEALKKQVPKQGRLFEDKQ